MSPLQALQQTWVTIHQMGRGYALEHFLASQKFQFGANVEKPTLCGPHHPRAILLVSLCGSITHS